MRFLSLFLLLLPFLIKAQPTCIVIHDTIPDRPEHHHCFNEQAIYDDCRTVYLKLNIHFFLDDNCEGSILFEDDPFTAQEEAYDLAERLINEANDMLGNNNQQWNQAWWGATETQPHCNPIQCLLKGVYIHCDTRAKNQGVNLINSSIGLPFHRNLNTEINVFVASVFGPGGATGVALRPGSLFAIENLDVGNFNHELGHALGLIHTFADDDCDDTPAILHDFDANCNGILELFERDRKCWTFIHDDDPRCNPDSTSLCGVDSCCYFHFQDNNVMYYSAYNWATSYTPCQIKRMLKTINDLHCNRIEEVGGCTPPSAFIDILPRFKNQTINCRYCINMEGSFNEDHYKLDFYEVDSLGNNISLVKTTGWIAGQAGSYCLEQYKQSRWESGFEGGKRYKALLIVEEDTCGIEDTFSLIFDLPVYDCDETLPPFTVDVSPIPLIGNTIHINYTLAHNSEIEILAAHGNVGLYNQPVESKQYKPSGNYQLNINTSHWAQGINVLIFKVDNLVYSTNVIKL